MQRETMMTVSGNVTRPPELKYRRSDGRPFVVVPVAVNNRRYDTDQQRYVDDGVTYYDVMARGSLGANALACLDVGLPVVAHGKFRVHEWTSETMKGARPCVIAESLGIDLTWGTASYAKGSHGYPSSSDDVQVSVPPAAEGGPAEAGDLDHAQVSDLHDGLPDDLEAELADADGVVDDETARELLARAG